MDIMGITLGRRTRVEVNGSSDTYFMELTASFEAGELKLEQLKEKVDALRTQIDGELKEWAEANRPKEVPAAAVEQQTIGGSVEPTQKQLNYLLILAKKSGMSETEATKYVRSIKTQAEASEAIRKLGGKK